MIPDTVLNPLVQSKSIVTLNRFICWVTGGGVLEQGFCLF